MKKRIFSLLATSLFLFSPLHLTYAQGEDLTHENQVELVKVSIEGLQEHYHTGEEILLTASAPEFDGSLNWQWSIKQDEQAEWQVVAGMTSESFSREATTDGLMIKAEVSSEEGIIIAESDDLQVHIDDHHSDHENAERIYHGFFYNDEVEDRSLADWEGEWSSVYPMLVSGQLDTVFEHKANDSMSAEEYKAYYAIGYETDVDRILIEGNNFTFNSTDGTELTAAYEYDGYDILTYERGNRGVRYVFKRIDDTEGMPAYIQFSDHLITETLSTHFHLYWGDDRETLLDEVTNWPTYYPSFFTENQILKDMLAH